ncbi:MAG: transglutaminase, partial [Deltaproteobacteria bacterium]
VSPLEFNGRDDSIFQAYNSKKQKFMEYVEYHGTYADIPVDEIVAAWKNAYSRDRVRKWINAFEQSGGRSAHHFDKEEITKS